MAEPVNARVADIYEASSKLSRYAFEPYWPEKKLKICVTGAGGFIARWDAANRADCGAAAAQVSAVHRRTFDRPSLLQSPGQAAKV